MTFAELEIGAYFRFYPGYIQYEKTSAKQFKTRLTLKPMWFNIVDSSCEVIEVK